MRECWKHVEREKRVLSIGKMRSEEMLRRCENVKKKPFLKNCDERGKLNC
jgi:hypothetical protein